MFDVSRLASGMTQSRYPCRSTQVISTFALWWIGMVHDYLSTGATIPAIPRSYMPGDARYHIKAFQRLIGAEGLAAWRGRLEHDRLGARLERWMPAVPPEGHTGVSGLLNWQYIYALRIFMRIWSACLGDAEQAAWAERFGRMNWRRKLRRLSGDAERGLLADNLAQTRFSEHTQLMALLSGRLESGLAAARSKSTCSQMPSWIGRRSISAIIISRYVVYWSGWTSSSSAWNYGFT